MKRQLCISFGSSHLSFGSSAFAYCRVKGFPIKIVNQIMDVRNAFEIIPIFFATNTSFMKLMVIAQLMKKSTVHHWRMKPFRNS
ncbi:MAG: hypothetical protein ABH843_04220 [Candidatus Omnitrophota bacterium]